MHPAIQWQQQTTRLKGGVRFFQYSQEYFLDQAVMLSLFLQISTYMPYGFLTEPGASSYYYYGNFQLKAMSILTCTNIMPYTVLSGWIVLFLCGGLTWLLEMSGTFFSESTTYWESLRSSSGPSKCQLLRLELFESRDAGVQPRLLFFCVGDKREPDPCENSMTLPHSGHHHLNIYKLNTIACLMLHFRHGIARGHLPVVSEENLAGLSTNLQNYEIEIVCTKNNNKYSFLL